MRVAIFPLHADGTLELAASLRKAEVFVMEKAPIRSMGVSSVLAASLAFHGAKVVSGRRDVIMAMRKVDVAILGSVKDQVQSFEKVIHGGIRRMPFAVRHGYNAFNDMAALEIPGFMSPSERALEIIRESLPSCETFLSRKIISPLATRPGVEPASSREGFFSYVNGYAKNWPREKEKFDLVATSFLGRNGIRLENIGHGSPAGFAKDMRIMPWAKGTVHLKGGHACCNAVTRSMSVGTPVIMDSSTRIKCFFDSIDGMIVRNSVKDIVFELDRLDRDDDYMEMEIAKAREAAVRQFSYDDAYGEALVEWLGGIEA